MYIPVAFRVEDPSKITALIQAYSFATIVTHDGKSSFASHLPVLFHADEGSHGILVSHMARANPQWKHFDAENEVLVIFQGPHAYISPAWYQEQVTVPTWNYAAVHAYGVPRLITEHARVAALLCETIETYEAGNPQRWAGDIPDEYRDQQMKAIVAFEIPVSRFEAKFKLGQNRTPEDLEGVYDALSKSEDSVNRALGELLRAEMPMN